MYGVKLLKEKEMSEVQSSLFRDFVSRLSWNIDELDTWFVPGRLGHSKVSKGILYKVFDNVNSDLRYNDKDVTGVKMVQVAERFCVSIEIPDMAIVVFRTNEVLVVEGWKRIDFIEGLLTSIHFHARYEEGGESKFCTLPSRTEKVFNEYWDMFICGSHVEKAIALSGILSIPLEFESANSSRLVFRASKPFYLNGGFRAGVQISIPFKTGDWEL